MLCWACSAFAIALSAALLASSAVLFAAFATVTALSDATLASLATLSAVATDCFTSSTKPFASTAVVLLSLANVAA